MHWSIVGVGLVAVLLLGVIWAGDARSQSGRLNTLGWLIAAFVVDAVALLAAAGVALLVDGAAGGRIAAAAGVVGGAIVAALYVHLRRGGA